MTPISIRFARPLLALIMLSSTATAQAAKTNEQIALDFLELFRPSITGSYMAGQQALDDLRTDEAARYFGQAAQADWENALLVERAFIAYAADGQIGQAATMAGTCSNSSPTMNWPRSSSPPRR